MEVFHFLDEVDGYVGREERHEKPARAVAVTVARFPKVRPFDFHHLAWFVDARNKPDEA